MNGYISKRKKLNRIIKLIISLLAVILIVLSLFYLRSVRVSGDPRVEKVELYYRTYEKSIKENDLKKAFVALDSIQYTYNKYIDYKNSYEMGQVLNRKAVNWIQVALPEKNDSIRLSYLDSARYYAENSINIFEQWIKDFNHLSRNEIIIKIQSNYFYNDSIFKGRNLVKIINKRTDEIISDQKETTRNLSLAYTNLGTVYQYFGEYKMAIKINRKALDIWSSNETAKINIKNLLDRSFH